MDKDLLEKHKNDPAWAEVIRLYSGLFDTQDERENFILDVAEEDILLAAECKTSSVEGEDKIFQALSDRAFSQGFSFDNAILSGKSIISLLELKNYEAIKIILKETYRRKPNKVHKEAIETIFKTNDIFLINQAVDVFLADRKTNKMFVGWIASSLNLNSPQEFIKSNNFYRLVEYFIDERYLEPLEYLFQKFGYAVFNGFDVKHLAEEFLKRGNRKDIRIAIFLIQKFKLNENYPANVIVKELTEHKTAGSNKRTNGRKKRLAQSIIVANNLEADFPNIKLAKVKTSHKDIVKNIIPQVVSIDYPLTILHWYECIVTNIIPSRVFVKIENETRPASIYIGELANKRIDNIFDFEYNGEKLHVGQKLIAKVISIDEQGRINLSLKQVRNGE